MRQIQERIELLKKKIRHHDRRYYVLSDPEISDKEYDNFYRELKSLEKEYPQFKTPDSPTQRLTDVSQKGFKTVRHLSKMFSLDNTYSYQELKDWNKRVDKGLKGKRREYVAELKIDGVSIALTYKKGILVLAATRGDGEKGEDVTLNVRTICSIPLKLFTANAPDTLEVRGEIYMPKSEFERLNKQRKKQGETLFANPRNATSGSLKLLDTKLTQERNLACFIHSYGIVKGRELTDQYEFTKMAKKWGLPTNPNVRLCKKLDEVISFCNSFEKRKEKLDYEIDGIVVKVNSFKQQAILGTTLKSPRWAIAYKYPAKQVTTEIINIVSQVGRTGVITPVAELKACECGGVIIKNATLHNFDEVERLGVKIGDRIVIERAGEVIPKVIKVIESVRTGKKKKFAVPKTCPACGSKIIREKEGEVAYRCLNSSCPAQLEKSLIHFASRSAMDIEGMGESVVAQLVKIKKVRDFSDIYSLTKNDLLKLELFKDKKADNLIAAIGNSKNRPFSRLIYALGIRQVGEKAAYVLAEKFTDIDVLARAKEEDIESIHEFGFEIASSVVSFFKHVDNKELIARLKKAGLNTTSVKSRRASRLSGKTFVFTGELSEISRHDAEEAVRNLGGNSTSSVSKNTDFVVVGINPGSKFQKAKQLNVKIIKERQLKKFIGGIE